jgi:hypothetical protein
VSWQAGTGFKGTGKFLPGHRKVKKEKTDGQPGILFDHDFSVENFRGECHHEEIASNSTLLNIDKRCKFSKLNEHGSSGLMGCLLARMVLPEGAEL